MPHFSSLANKIANTSETVRLLSHPDRSLGQAASVVSAAEKIATRGVAQKKRILRDAAKGTGTIMGAIRRAGERGNRISFDPMIHHTSFHCSNVHGYNKIRDQTRDINSGRWRLFN